MGNINYATLAWVSLGISAISIYFAFNSFLGFSANREIESVLGTLVTILVGWQIYNVIGIDKRIEQAKADLKDYTAKEVSKSLSATKYDAVGSALSQLAMVLYFNKQYGDAFLICFNSISTLYEGSGDKSSMDDMRFMTDTLLKIIEFLEQDENIDKRICTQHESYLVVFSAAVRLANDEDNEIKEKGDKILKFLHQRLLDKG